MPKEHRARITWSAQQEQLGLPAIRETIDPAFFDDETPTVAEGWSLACRFDRTPLEQGNPSEAYVRFWMDNLPEHRLGPGASLQLFERQTGRYAHVVILTDVPNAV